MDSRAKRMRYMPTAVPGSAGVPGEDPAQSAASIGDGFNGLTGAAERKRELERNRRNLVNARFAELEAQLASLPGAPKRVYRRIDKEVVLKDATQGLAAQQRDLEQANTRLASMTTEITTLRSEKLELRHDKAYLHKELANSRTENKALANDNLLLWQALCKSGAVKSTLPQDLAKIPVHLIFGNNHPSANTAITTATATGSTQENCNNNCNNNSGAFPSSSPNHSNQVAPHTGQEEEDEEKRQGMKRSVEIASEPDFFRNLSVDLGTPQNGASTTNPAGEDFLKGIAVDAFGSIHHPLTSSALLQHFALENTPENNNNDSNGMRLSEAADNQHPDIAPCG